MKWHNQGQLMTSILPYMGFSDAGTFPGGTIVDWEHVFEHDEEGIIPVVTRAKTISGLKACVHTVTENLFTRATDGPIRRAYEYALSDLLPAEDQATNIEEPRARVIALLRSIKEHRKEKALDHIQDQYFESMSNQSDETWPASTARRSDKPVDLGTIAAAQETLSEALADEDEPEPPIASVPGTKY